MFLTDTGDLFVEMILSTGDGAFFVFGKLFDAANFSDLIVLVLLDSLDLIENCNIFLILLFFNFCFV